MDRQVWPGAALAVVGSLSMAFVLWWQILPVLGLVFAGAAIMRARVFHQHRPISHDTTA